MENPAWASSYWWYERGRGNFEDGLFLVIAEGLFQATPPSDFDICIVGGFLSDDIVPQPGGPGQGKSREAEKRVCCWGSGLLGPGALTASAADRLAILAVRGPLTASALRPGESIPVGEPALLLPALYQPRRDVRYLGKSVCVPDHDDNRPDREILEASGCNLVLRPPVEAKQPAIHGFIDALASAGFVLAGAFHGATIAAAYGTPFAFWGEADDEQPFAWRDFCGLLRIALTVHPDLESARAGYASIKPALEIPVTWPILTRSPFPLRMSGVVEVLNYELAAGIFDAADYKAALDGFTAQASQLHRAAGSAKARRDANDGTGVRGLLLQRHRSTETSAERLPFADEGAADADDRDAEDMVARNGMGQADNIDKLVVAKSPLDRERGDAGDEQQGRDELSIVVRQVAAPSKLPPLRPKSHDDELFSRKLHEVAAQLSAAQNELTRVGHERDVLYGELLQARRAAKAASGNAAVAVRKLLPLLDWAAANRGSLLFGAGRQMRFRLTGILDSIARDVDAIEAYVREYNKFRGTAESTRLRILQTCVEIGSELMDLPLFSAIDYSTMYSDVAASGLSPLSHFVTRGRAEDRCIHPLLDNQFYGASHPEVAAFQMTPCLHYIHYGADKGFDPHPLFDSKSYLERYPDVRHSGLTPLEHYIRNPLCNPHPLFDSAYYLGQNPDVMAAGLNPLVHFVLFGAREGRRPHPLFHTEYYLAVNADVAAVGVNPLVHYLTYGWKEGRDPNPELYGQLLTSGSGRSNPLLEYLARGEASSARSIWSMPDARLREGGAPSILMIDALFPRPDQDSGSLDQIGFMRIFISLGFRVYFCPTWEFGGNPEREQELSALGVECVRSPDFRNLDEFLLFNGKSIVASFVSRVALMESCYDILREFCPRSPIIFNTVDIHHLREQREATLRRDEQLARKARETRAKETTFIKSSDLTIVVSQREAEMISKEVEGANVITIPLIREWTAEAVPDFDTRRGICFIGGFAHQPNVDAVEYFVGSIWPAIVQRQPDMEFYIVGSNMPQRLRDLDVRGVVPIGFVEDLPAWLANIRLTVAPLRYGAGAKGKIVSSVGSGVPCVSTAIGAEGMGLVDGETIVVVDSEAAFAEQVLRLYNDNEHWQRLSQAGLAFIRENYSLEAGREILKSHLRQLGVRLPGNLGRSVAGRRNA